MSVRSTIVVGAAVIALAIGANAALEPKTPAEQRQQINEQRMEDLSDADGNNKDRMRDEGNDAVNGENTRKLDTGEHRPPERIKLRIRIP